MSLQWLFGVLLAAGCPLFLDAGVVPAAASAPGPAAATPAEAALPPPVAVLPLATSLWHKIYDPLSSALGNQAHMVQFATLAMLVALFIIWWRK